MRLWAILKLLNMFNLVQNFEEVIRRADLHLETLAT